MKEIWKEIGLALILGMVLPGVMLHLAVSLSPNISVGEPERVETLGMEPEYDDFEIKVLTDDGKINTLELEIYITGVVLAEMPASFEMEALKAQAVVARTYTMRADTGKSKHDGAAVCTESSCCQAYRSPDDYLQSGGTTEKMEKVRSAVLETRGYVLTYEGELIEATYFSCSGGSTEDAVAVWGTEIPYLVATDSPGEEEAAHYSDRETFTYSEFLGALSLETNQPPEEWFGAVTYTAGGGVEEMEICGSVFSGVELRNLLNLRSTAITMSISGDTVTVHTRGFGHRVGMSQYGADAMAVQGSGFEEILAHYYRGTMLKKLTD